MTRFISFTLLFITLGSHLYGQTCTATGGSWTSAGTWDCGYPFPGGTTDLVIPPGVTVFIPPFTGVTFNGTISVYGTLTVGILSSLSMDASSSVQVYTNGAVNGFLSLVLVGGTPIGTFPPLTGPQAIDNSGGGQPLPVEVLYFTAQSKNDHVELSWATASEENFDYFSLERSANGEDFKEIAQINGSGTSTSQIDYKFVDDFPLNGKSYYRIRSIDFDGYTEVFETVIVDVEGIAKDFNIYPNPIVNNSFRIQTNFTDAQPAKLIIYNNVGQVEDEFVIDSWLTTHELETSRKGIYFFKIFTLNGTIVKRVLVN